MGTLFFFVLSLIIVVLATVDYNKFKKYIGVCHEKIQYIPSQDGTLSSENNIFISSDEEEQKK